MNSVAGCWAPCWADEGWGQGSNHQGLDNWTWGVQAGPCLSPASGGAGHCVRQQVLVPRTYKFCLSGSLADVVKDLG